MLVCFITRRYDTPGCKGLRRDVQATDGAAGESPPRSRRDVHTNLPASLTIVDDPNLGASAQMRRGRARYRLTNPVRAARTLIGVDLLPHALVFLGVDAHGSRPCFPAFRRAPPKRRRAAIRKAAGSGHRRAWCREMKSSPISVNSIPRVFDHRSRTGRIQIFDRAQTPPNGHSESLSLAATRR